MTPEYQYGTPSLEEWHGLWKHHPADSDVTENEYYNEYRSLTNWLSKYGRCGIREDSDFFVTGDCQGDKSQCVELVNPQVLTMEFLKHLQQWLIDYYPNSRIIIPTYLHPHNVIIVYKDVVRANDEYEISLDEGLKNIVEAMLMLEAYQHVKRS